MRQEFIVKGVPDSIRLDGWWLDLEGERPERTPKGALFASLRMRHAVPMLGALVTLADWLFWQQPWGVSVAVFAIVLAGAMLALRSERPSLRQGALGLGLVVLSSLPVGIELHLLSLTFCALGLICLAVWCVFGAQMDARLVLRAALRLPTVGAVRLFRVLLSGLPAADLRIGLRREAAYVLLPLAMGALFLALFAMANPLVEEALSELDLSDLFDAEVWLRLMFWAVMAALIWPYLTLSAALLGGTPPATLPQYAGPTRASYLVNPRSVRNTLILCNLLFLLQTTFDLGILTGGVALPRGMSYAAYAHRGAYPLVVTALLAGVFTLVTRPMIAADRQMRGLVYLWLGQNMVLVATAAVRLQSYVAAYALTYMRLAAFVWMGLVLVGLLLTVVQVRRDLPSGWLLRRCAALVLAVLYLSCFVNLANLIAGYNLAHAPTSLRYDASYVCALGVDAYPAIRAYDLATDGQLCEGWLEVALQRTPIETWREWGFRRARIQAYYQAQFDRMPLDADPYFDR
ncbi:DUF4153 domain-containing protein [Arenibacterium sp. LLYu02]|uniref:DUF4153 domain-containing protein n=1 Tax=Arenibacterium sp. LLYu02 TaxID=3404132 RepID=UPI003B212F58